MTNTIPANRITSTPLSSILSFREAHGDAKTISVLIDMATNTELIYAPNLAVSISDRGTNCTISDFKQRHYIKTNDGLLHDTGVANIVWGQSATFDEAFHTAVNNLISPAEVKYPAAANDLITQGGVPLVVMEIHGHSLKFA